MVNEPSVFEPLKVYCNNIGNNYNSNNNDNTLESPHQGDSNEYTQDTNFNLKKKIIINYPESAVMGFFQRGSRTSSKQPW